ncbi:MAG: FecR domain-containing protein [Desulfovibrionaceae bacterium]|nr:FecR domain-containing protein [Desulfovibrionaceae bacterium]
MLHLLLLAVLFGALALPGPARAADLLGHVVRLQGAAGAEEQGGDALRPLAVGAPVYAAETVRTEPDARVEIALFDGTRVTLGGETAFTFDSLVVDPAANAGSAGFELLAGAFRLASGRVTEQGKTDVAVRTPLGTIGIRGTDFWGGYFGSGEIGVFLFSGHPLIVENELGARSLPPGMGVFLRSGAVPTPASPWGAKRLDLALAAVAFAPQ